MKFREFRRLCTGLLLTSAAACLVCIPQRVLAMDAPPAAKQASAATGAVSSQAPLLNEEVLRRRFMDKMVFLRGCYLGDNLEFDENGKVDGSPKSESFTLSALEIRKIHLDKHKLEFTADRYALHFFGVLPYQSTAREYDKVKISKNPVHITIKREEVVTPKKKKEKKQKAEKDAKDASPAPAVGQAAMAEAALPPPRPGTTYSPAHSSQLLEKAIESIFATSIDKQMIAHMPSYWQQYFISKQEHRQFIPSDTRVVEVGDGVTAPKLLNAIDPGSNQIAQKFGVAGLTLFRTVIDASGKPEEVAIARPIGFGLDENAVKAIQGSHFKPAMKDGHPVPVVTDIVVTFRIFSNRTKPGSVPKGAKLTEVVASAWDAAAPPPETKKH